MNDQLPLPSTDRPPQDAWAVVERVLASHLFRGADRQRQLLRFIVDRSSVGDPASLKESVIAMEVFGRNSSFDPRSDSLVRVEARKLRENLVKYYAGEGQADPVAITIPKGGYVAVLEKREKPAAPLAGDGSQPPRQRVPGAAVWGAIGLLLLAGILWIGLKLRPAQSSTPLVDRIDSMAVLPFVNMNATKEDEYFSDGLTEQVIDNLSRVEGLRVVSRTSSFQFKNRSTDVRQVGKSLNARAVLEGSVRKDGGRIRVTAQLVDAVTGFHLWSRTYDRELKDVIDVQAQLARDIIFTVRNQSGARDEIQLPLHYTSSPAAYDLYLKGLFAYDRNSKEGLESSIEEYQRALSADPAYAPALSAMADSYVALGIYGMWRPSDAIPKARLMAERALRIDSSLAEAHAVLGFVSAAYDWNWPESQSHFSKSIQQNPNCAHCRAWYSFYYLAPRGQAAEAYGQLAKTIELDPLEKRFQSFRVAIPLYLRQFDQAIEEGQRAINQNSDDYVAHLFLGFALRHKGRFQEALKEDERTAELTHYSALALRNLGDLYGAMGERKKAAAVLDQLTELSQHSYVSPAIFAIVYSSLGNTDSALEWLARAVQEHDLYLIFIQSWPLYDKLKGDPRFEAISKRVGDPD